MSDQFLALMDVSGLQQLFERHPMTKRAKECTCGPYAEAVTFGGAGGTTAKFRDATGCPVRDGKRDKRKRHVHEPFYCGEEPNKPDVLLYWCRVCGALGRQHTYPLHLDTIIRWMRPKGDSE